MTEYPGIVVPVNMNHVNEFCMVQFYFYICVSSLIFAEFRSWFWGQDTWFSLVLHGLNQEQTV